MNRFFIFLLLSCFLNATQPQWNREYSIELKKDEIYNIELYTNNNNIKKMSIRWTLFHNDALIILVKYDGFPYQNVLYNTSGKNSIKINIANSSKRGFEAPFIALFFDKFVKKDKKAIIGIKTFGDFHIFSEGKAK